MHVPIRVMTEDAGCVATVADIPLEQAISASVGAGGANVRSDVETIQSLLNGVTPAAGGPRPALGVDGLVGPLTTGAIRRFQTTQFGWADGRVDPGKQTIRRLLDLYEADFATVGADASDAAPTGAAAPGADDMKHAIRIATAVSVVPDVKQAIALAIQRIDFASLACLQPNLGANSLIALINKHFRTGAKPSPAMVADLDFIKKIYRRMKIVFDDGSKGGFGGNLWGVSIFEIDRWGTRKRALAFTGRGNFFVPPNQTRNLQIPIKGSTIYFCDHIDGRSRDFFIETILHELGHFVSDVDFVAGIADHAQGWERAKYASIGKWHRMRNADTYAMFAFELAFGTLRMMPQVKHNPDFLNSPVVRGDGAILESWLQL